MRLFQKTVIIPVITGVILCLVSFFSIKNTDAYLPFRQGTIFAYHDSQPHKAENANSVTDNSLIGSVELADKQFDLVFENDYSNMKKAVSMLKNGSTPNEYGCVYLKTISSNAKTVSSSETIKLNTVYGSFKYKYTDSFVAESEYEVLTYSPRAKKSVVFFYQKTPDIGISSDYEVYVFEEVK